MIDSVKGSSNWHPMDHEYSFYTIKYVQLSDRCSQS